MNRFEVETAIWAAVSSLRAGGNIDGELHLVNAIYRYDSAGGFWTTKEEDLDKFPRITLNTTRREVFENQGSIKHTLVVGVESIPEWDKRPQAVAISEDIITLVVRTMLRNNKTIQLPPDNELVFTFQNIDYFSKHRTTTVNAEMTFDVDKQNICNTLKLPQINE